MIPGLPLSRSPLSRTLNSRSLLLRADASVSIGTGHVMRCLALAQAWQDAGGLAVFAMAEATPAVVERLQREDMELMPLDAEPGSVEDAQETIALARTKQAVWVVVDGYRFGADYQLALTAAGLKVLFIDDNGHAGRYAADIVLNQNIHAGEFLYRDREKSTRLLLGTKYALLRREFVSANHAREIPLVARKLLVSLGGSDPDDITRRVLEALEHVAVADLQVVVVAGGSNPHGAAIAELAANSTHNCRVLNNVANMQEVMSWADLAISAAGTTCWECCALSLPAVLVVVADNQILNAEALRAAGAVKLISGGSQFAIGEMAQLVTSLANSASERQTLSQTASALLDCGGTRRILSILMGEDSSETKEGP
jgi:UDP-2,4-diacetamido-2,4,6-trideoxy-beta-L-altropyranose hydrolase